MITLFYKVELYFAIWLVLEGYSIFAIFVTTDEIDVFAYFRLFCIRVNVVYEKYLIILILFSFILIPFVDSVHVINHRLYVANILENCFPIVFEYLVGLIVFEAYLLVEVLRLRSNTF
jgi:hypothetical protein